MTLDQEVSLWSKKGYRVLSRTASAAQLSKPKDSPLLIGACILPVLLGAWTLVMLPFTWAASLFVIGVVLLAAWHAVRGEHLVYLTVTPSGEITQD